ncbi:hypothetical protein [Mesobacillus zeae]|uniref:hypothetical protein n=1 Tax=Mesobacillus zeae TaxID=1917180 RepID=UPI00115F2DB7|nr:hypothetical protein [Mesobacillus zeae]
MSRGYLGWLGRLMVTVGPGIPAMWCRWLETVGLGIPRLCGADGWKRLGRGYLGWLETVGLGISRLVGKRGVTGHGWRVDRS